MVEERITERNDGVTQERTVERGQPSTVLVERRGGSGGLIAVLAIVVLAVLAYFLFLNNSEERAQTDAVSDAAGAVGDAARDVGDAAKKAVE